MILRCSPNTFVGQQSASKSDQNSSTCWARRIAETNKQNQQRQDDRWILSFCNIANCQRRIAAVCSIGGLGKNSCSPNGVFSAHSVGVDCTLRSSKIATLKSGLLSWASQLTSSCIQDLRFLNGQKFWLRERLCTLYARSYQEQLFFLIARVVLSL